MSCVLFVRRDLTERDGKTEARTEDETTNSKRRCYLVDEDVVKELKRT